MEKRSKYILGIFALVLLGIILFEGGREKPIDWRDSFTYEDKIPFGSYIIGQEFKNITGQEVELIEQNTIDFLQDSTQNSIGENLFFCDDNLYFDDVMAEKLLQYAHKGNKVFMSSRYFGSLEDTLKFQQYADFNLMEDSLTLTLVNPAFKNKKYYVPKIEYSVRAVALDTANTIVLGEVYQPRELTEAIKVNEPLDSIYPNFFEVKVGKGSMIFHMTPKAFTNYNMLKGDPNYTAALLSYLNPGKIYLDTYYKTGRKIVKSPLRFILQSPSLKWAYYLLITGILFIFLFRSKREQRVIPIIKPLKNQTVEFVKTIGDMYFEHRDYADIIHKKISYFMEYLRSTYHMNTDKLDDVFIHRLAVKSAKPEAEVKELIQYIKVLNANASYTEENLIKLNDLIEQFQSESP